MHRDIKPRNIFGCRMGSEDDFVKVLDFGLVKLRQADETATQLTTAGVTAGTPAYMAPEIVTAAPTWTAGPTCTRLAASPTGCSPGQLVFEAENAMAIVLAHVQQEPCPSFPPH